MAPVFHRVAATNSRTVIQTSLHNHLKSNTVQHSHLVLCTRAGRGGAGPSLTASVSLMAPFSSSPGTPGSSCEISLQDKRKKMSVQKSFFFQYNFNVSQLLRFFFSGES